MDSDAPQLKQWAKWAQKLPRDSLHPQELAYLDKRGLPWTMGIPISAGVVTYLSLLKLRPEMRRLPTAALATVIAYVGFKSLSYMQLCASQSFGGYVARQASYRILGDHIPVTIRSNGAVLDDQFRMANRGHTLPLRRSSPADETASGWSLTAVAQRRLMGNISSRLDSIQEAASQLTVSVLEGTAVGLAAAAGTRVGAYALGAKASNPRYTLPWRIVTAIATLSAFGVTSTAVCTRSLYHDLLAPTESASRLRNNIVDSGLLPFGVKQAVQVIDFVLNRRMKALEKDRQ